MGLSLGIHLGHHASCAVVKDGVLCSAVQLERLSRKKHHSVESLWDLLPIVDVLETVNATINDVDTIVSCFQGGSPGGFGLHHPLIEPSFSLFDPFSDHHHTLSHHLAHAYCSAAYAPKKKLGILISDYAGSSTIDGKDYDCAFSDWYKSLINCNVPVVTKTECLSIYEVDFDGEFTLKDREFHVPHPMSESAICSVATLYENVSQCVFREMNAHGSLMALAAYGDESYNSIGPLVDITKDSISFRNDWQHKVYDNCEYDAVTGSYKLSISQASSLARLCQSATEDVLLAYAKRTSDLCKTDHLALGGGIFLNILANTRITESGLFKSVSLPSSPHDAGISVGCAFRGAKLLGDSPSRVKHDRLGPIYSKSTWLEAIERNKLFVTSQNTTPQEIAAKLVDGAIIARCAGQSEFGPRALGGRSLLASPTNVKSKERLNKIKQRQSWRPVAPVVASGHLMPALIGDSYSPWMTFTHKIVPEHRDKLPALSHPDHSTRTQILEQYQDPWLYTLLEEHSKLTGYHILCNTSLNGPGEPILESPIQAVQWFLENEDVDFLLLNEHLVNRKNVHQIIKGIEIKQNPEAHVILTNNGTECSRSCILKLDTNVVEIKSQILLDKILENQSFIFDTEIQHEDNIFCEVVKLLIGKYLLWVCVKE